MMILFQLFAVASGNFEVDIDKMNTSSYKIWINEKYYSCTPKTPPLSHSWSYECTGTQRRLRGRDSR